MNINHEIKTYRNKKCFLQAIQFKEETKDFILDKYKNQIGILVTNEKIKIVCEMADKYWFISYGDYLIIDNDVIDIQNESEFEQKFSEVLTRMDDAE